MTRWISHLLGIDVTIEPLTELHEAKLTWYVGLDSEATVIGDRLWHGEALDEETAGRVLALFRLQFADATVVADRVEREPVYLIMAMTSDRKPADEAAEPVDGIAGQAPGGRNMSPAATPLLRIPVGVVVERRKADSPWIDFVWRGVGVLPDEPEMKPWTVLREEDEATLYYAGSASVDLYRSETARYRDNLATGSPSTSGSC